MKAPYRLTAALLLFLCLLGCAPETQDTQSTIDSTPTLSNEEIYDQARAKLLASPNQVINYTWALTRTVGQQDYTESSTGTASIGGIGTDALEAMVKETLTYGTLQADHTLTYCNGSAYSQISGCTFTQPMETADFLSKQLPAALIDRALYETMEVQTTIDGAFFTFKDASQLEGWVNGPSDAQFTDSSGTATLNTNGLLVASTYTATYTRGTATYRLEIDIKTSTPATLDLSAVHPEHYENAVPLACLDAPKLLMRAVGDIFTARDMACTISETIYSQAIPLIRKRQATATISGSGQNMVATLDSAIQATVYQGQPTLSSQNYRFEGGVCTSTVNGGEPSVQAGVTAESMRTSIEDAILSGLFATRYLAGAELTETEDLYILRFQGNDAYCTDLSGDIGAFLNMDLDGLATSYETTEAAGYLAIHKQTALPTAMGISFARTHIFGEVPNQLTYQLDQALQFSPQQ